MKSASLLLLLALGASGLLHAQRFDFANSHLPVLSLDGQWRFHTGDNPAWADPKFDDSKWELLRSDQNWAEQGHAGYSGLAWYRFQVDVPSELNEISLYLPYILTSYQVYASGQLVGAYGKMPPHPIPYWGGGWFRSYPFSLAKGADRKIVIAIRVWHWPGWAEDFGGGPSEGGSLIGETSVIEQRDALSRAAHHWDLASTMILALLQTLAGICSLVLFLLIRSDREYLWFGVMMLIGAVAGWLSLSFAFDEWNVFISFPLQDALPLVGVSLAEAAFYRRLLKGQRTVLFYVAVASILLILLYLIIQSYATIDPAFQTGLRATTVNLLETLLLLPLDVWIFSLLFIRARENLFDARLLLAPVLLQKLAQVLQGAAIVTYNLGWQDKFGYDIAIVHQPFQIELLQVVDALFMMAIFGILIYRFTRTRSQEERYAADFSAARTVQQMLIPKERPQIPGLTIESEYRPAREVGGDFFQVLPHTSDGSVLIVVGDVAGKGLQAAMLVAHMVGVLRNEAVHSSEPTYILAALNACLCERDYSLATCVALRIARDGSTTLANAGHLPPYLNRKELLMEGALPLGAIPGAGFSVLSFHFAEGDDLMLMSDGIAEAQDENGRLFGFERVSEMLHQNVSASALATAAQAFGQEDDITILMVARTAMLTPSTG